MRRQWCRVLLALCLAILACVDVQAATQSMPTEIDLAQVPSDVRKEAETKAQKLCGWSAETLAKVQEDVAANETAAASPGKAKEKPKTRRLLVGGKVGGGAAQAKPAAGAGTGVPNDPDALAKLLCAELDVAKKLDAVGDRLEEELEETLELEENIEAKRARARKREEEAAERVRRQETIFGIVLVVGGISAGAYYAYKAAQAAAEGTNPNAPAPSTDAQNEDLKKRLNKLRAATATRT